MNYQQSLIWLIATQSVSQKKAKQIQKKDKKRKTWMINNIPELRGYNPIAVL